MSNPADQSKNLKYPAGTFKMGHPLYTGCFILSDIDDYIFREPMILLKNFLNESCMA